MTDNQLFTSGYSLLFMVAKAYLNTTIENIPSDGDHTVWDSDRGQAAAAIESTISDGSQAVGNGNGCQSDATRENIISNGGHAVGDVNGCQAAAIIES